MKNYLPTYGQPLPNTKKLMCGILAIVLVLNGCASVFKLTELGEKFELDNINESKNATVYLYSPWRLGVQGRNLSITINDEEIVTLLNGGYTKIIVTPGRYIIDSILVSHAKSTASSLLQHHMDHMVLNARENQTYFIRVLPDYSFKSNGFEFSIIDADKALEEISDTYYVRPKRDFYQYNDEYKITCKVGDKPANCKEDSINLPDKSGFGRLALVTFVALVPALAVYTLISLGVHGIFKP